VLADIVCTVCICDATTAKREQGTSRLPSFGASRWLRLPLSTLFLEQFPSVPEVTIRVRLCIDCISPSVLPSPLAMRSVVHKISSRAAKHQCIAGLRKSSYHSVYLQSLNCCLREYPSSKSLPHWSSLRIVYPQPVRYVSSAQKARDLNQQGIDEQESSLDSALSEEREKQARTPWHREGADEPPVRRQRSAGAMTKGRILRQAIRLD
jgi:hypothetical protein